MAIYFLSDFHLGYEKDDKLSIKREKFICNFLQNISEDADEIYLLGDIFDYWMEYHNTMPKRHFRFIQTLMQICDKGIPVHYFLGNHDQWMLSFFEKEIGCMIWRNFAIHEHQGLKIMLGHGDLFPQLTIKQMLMNHKTIYSIYRCIPPSIGLYWMKKVSLNQKYIENYVNGWLPEFDHKINSFISKSIESFDCMITGHFHYQIKKKYANNVDYFCVGQSLNTIQYLRLNDREFKFFEHK